MNKATSALCLFLPSEGHRRERQQKREECAGGGGSLQNRVKRLRVISSKRIKKDLGEIRGWMATVKKRLTSGCTLNFKSVGIADGLCTEYESVWDHCKVLNPTLIGIFFYLIVC